MTRPQKPWLDWRRERQQLSQILSRQGGVVRVQATSAGPLLEFAGALRSHLEHGQWSRPWRTIQFDPDNSNTRYFGEMTRQMERTLALSPDSPTELSLGSGTKIASDLNAASISINNSFNFGQNEYEQSVLQERRIDRIVANIRQRAKAEAFCFIFLQSESFLRQDLNRFRTLMWIERLESLANTCVLLLDFTRCAPHPSGDWPPTPDVNITLADEYDEPARENAVSDLASFLHAKGLEKSELEAQAYSRAVLDHHRGPATLYAQLAAVLASHKPTSP